MKNLEYLDPLSYEALVRLYNAEHPEQHTKVEVLTLEEVKTKYPKIYKKYEGAINKFRNS